MAVIARRFAALIEHPNHTRRQMKVSRSSCDQAVLLLDTDLSPSYAGALAYSFYID